MDISEVQRNSLSRVEIIFDTTIIAYVEGVIEDGQFFVKTQMIYPSANLPKGFRLISFESVGGGFRESTPDMPGFRDLFELLVNHTLAHRFSELIELLRGAPMTVSRIQKDDRTSVL